MTWSQPKHLGGCPITNYVLLRDDGDGGDVNIQIDPQGVASRSKPFEYTVTFDSAYTGKFVNVKVQAFNALGSTTSRSTLLVLASVPDKPSPAPQVDSSGTTMSQIKVNFVNENTDDGGSPVLKTELQMDDGNQGDFTTILITSTRLTFIVSDQIQKGLQYRFRYRVANVNGWSQYSDASFIFAFSSPDAPPEPVYV